VNNVHEWPKQINECNTLVKVAKCKVKRQINWWLSEMRDYLLMWTRVFAKCQGRSPPQWREMRDRPWDNSAWSVKTPWTWEMHKKCTALVHGVLKDKLWYDSCTWVYQQSEKRCTREREHTWPN
jgi:hypothetical protein